MRKLVVNRKSGFKVNDPQSPVNIRDYRGIMFYSTEPILPVYCFNLPPGEYYVDSGSFSPLTLPISFKLPKLPWPEKMFAVPPYDFKISFADNPNKCSIFWGEKKIVFDNSFINEPLPNLYFIYFHEIGHSKYGYNTLYTAKQNEAYCDLFASRKMLEMGFNPSQVLFAPKATLSHRQDYRKDFIEETLLNNAYK